MDLLPFLVDVHLDGAENLYQSPGNKGGSETEEVNKTVNRNTRVHQPYQKKNEP